MVETCTTQTTRGKPCSAPAWRDGLCRWHHPALDAERAEWRERGGRNRSNAVRAAKRLPAELRDVKAALLRALHDVESGQLEPARASAMARLAAVLLAVDQRGSPASQAVQQVKIVSMVAVEPVATTEREAIDEHAMRASTAAHARTEPTGARALAEELLSGRSAGRSNPLIDEIPDWNNRSTY